MNKIIVKIEPGMGQQHILFYEDDKLETEEMVPLDGIENFLLNTCYEENCYNLHFIGNWRFLEGIIDNISYQEQTQYNTHKILIEVN